MVRTVALAVASLALLLPTAAQAAPNVTGIRDARGDQRSSGPIPRAAAASIDIRRVDAAREPGMLIVTFRLADVRRLAGHRQKVSARLTTRGVLPQTFSTSGSRVTKSSDRGERTCGRASRRPGRDTVTMVLPFSCIRTAPGLMPFLVGTAEAVPAGGAGTAVDATRRFRADAR